jgi:hypothetical protein
MVFCIMRSLMICTDHQICWSNQEEWVGWGMWHVQGCWKSLAGPTFQCCRMESIVSLERGVCSCAELQVFSCYRGWKEPCQATCKFGRYGLFPSWSGYGLITTTVEGFCCVSLRERDHWEDLGVYGRMIWKVDLEEVGFGWVGGHKWVWFGRG